MRFLLALVCALMLVPAVASAADFVWATDAVEATRFVDKTSKVVGKAEKGKRLELLSREGERVRVRVEGSKFGWVDAAKTSATDPNKADTDTDTDTDADTE